ncbi:hypothetical protein L873DRAFT_1785641 [Choiromyces venosus 120613-1]|uniref:Retrovirus-related Pol polyprotein from transposon TNT 1-94-like beta-barrel domain-containing protein n=1 Tax=Choiromyces venosus 120613-1 TaxID=1336337 RepID=A0A3N4K844_9PEZI|nr:hypothetical protein L873DRAFT_1785641 [Choiromyces venosus 120613-1]
MSTLDDSDCTLSALDLSSSLTVNSSPTWYLDSTYTNHITHFGNFLDNYLLLPIPQPIKVGNGATMDAIVIGTIMLPIVTTSGSYIITLSDVYCTPDFKDMSLISLGQLQECGSRYSSSPSGITFQKGDQTVHYGYSVG